MKRATLILFFFLGISTFSNGQTSKGTVAIGADFPRFFTGLSRSGMKLNAGIFLADNFILGVNSGIRRRSLTSLRGDDLDGPALDVGLFVRYYFPDQGSDFRIHLQGEGGLDRTWAGGLTERYEFAGFGGGLSYFFHPNLSVEAASMLRVNNRDDSLHFNLSGWRLGIRYFIGNEEAE